MLLTGANSSVLASCSHVQTVRLPISGRWTREDRPAQSDASRRTVDGRLEEVLPGGDVQLADETHLSLGRREEIAREKEDAETQFEMQKLPVVDFDSEMLSELLDLIRTRNRCMSTGNCQNHENRHTGTALYHTSRTIPYSPK